jgi:hypothetical protein
MSRIIVFGLDRIAAGEFRAPVTRGYGLDGSALQQGGMSTLVTLPTSALGNDWMQFGRMVLVHDEGDLVPPWVGMIDAPWTPTLPAQATFYGPEYLMQLRTPDTQIVLSGVFTTVLTKLINMVNSLGDMGLQLGEMGELPDGQQQLTVKQTALWGQINDFAKRESVEFALRPTYDSREKLIIYLDADQNMGVYTGTFLHDGKGANIKILSASVIGPVWNRVIGVGKQSTKQGQLKTIPMSDEDSSDVYGLRSTVMQFGTLTVQSSLDAATRNYLEGKKTPNLSMNIEITDQTIFPDCRLGNVFDLHAAELYLPGGKKGWRGYARLKQMVYDEAKNTITATVVSKL